MAKRKAKQLPVPPAAEADPRAIEMIRGWIANKGLHLSLNIGVWGKQGITEETAWGMMLADVIRHVANALQEREGSDRESTIRMIKQQLDDEIDEPTSRHRGKFVDSLKD
jgi:Domain of unknown function (DUF5076)